MYANGLGQWFPQVRAYQIGTQAASIFDDPRFSATVWQPGDTVAPTSPIVETVTAIVPELKVKEAPAVVVSPNGAVPPPPEELLVSNGFPLTPDVTFLQAPAAAPGDVSVTVEGADVAAPRGFGMMEAAIAAGLAALLASAWTRDRKKRR